MRTQIKRILRHTVQHGLSFLFVCILSLVLIQPDKFEVGYQQSSNDYVLAAYEDILNSAEENDGSIAFESLIVGEDGQAKITYVVQWWDTLGKIAKNFGTTISTIISANNLEWVGIHPGDRLTITYNEGIIYEIGEPISLTKFAADFELNVEDLLTLNYLDDPLTELEIGTQLFVDLNKVEAVERGLLEKKQHEMLTINIPQPSDADLIWQPSTDSPVMTDPSEEQLPSEEDIQPEADIDQKVISAEETEQHLQNIEEEELPDTLDSPEDVEETQDLCGENKCELDGECYTKPDNAVCTSQDSKNARKCGEGYEEKGRKCIEISSRCPEHQCEHDNKCYTRPNNSICTPEDRNNARKCEEGFEENGKLCIAIPAEVTPKSIPTAAPTPPTNDTIAPDEIINTAPNPSAKKEEIVAKRYFNPRNAWFPGYGRWAGHCTEYAAYYRWKHYGINLRDYIRGNAWARYSNAANAGLSVGQIPTVWSIVVMKYGSSGRSSYGHAAIVTQVDLTNRMVRVQDANFLGRFVVTDHWIDMDSIENPIVWYIYPGT